MSGSVSRGAAEVGSKPVSAEQVLAAIRPGSRIFLGTGCAAPRKLLATLEAMSPGPADLEFVSFVTTSALPEGGGASKTRYRYRTFFVGSDVRHLAGQLDYVPISLEEVPKLLAAGRLHPGGTRSRSAARRRTTCCGGNLSLASPAAARAPRAARRPPRRQARR
jgi:acyl-CoA hydrolase